ncbi:MAG: glycerol-3-phosphate responsive antiterminator [Rhodospirillaceae bacterium]
MTANRFAPNGSSPRYAASTDHDRSPPLRALLTESPIIPALRDPLLLDRALAAHGRIIYLLCGGPGNLDDLVGRIKGAGKSPIVNIDLISGFSRDKAALTYLAERGVEGIISTHAECLNQARSLGLYVIQRTFLLDSAAMANICSQIKSGRVDAVEVLPALALPKLIPSAKEIAPDIALVGGGLISTMEEITTLLDRGVQSVSVSDPQLWIK